MSFRDGVNRNTGTRIAGRAWPTENRRPHETIAEWCRRLDDYSNLPAERSETRSSSVGCGDMRVALSAASRGAK